MARHEFRQSLRTGGEGVSLRLYPKDSLTGGRHIGRAPRRPQPAPRPTKRARPRRRGWLRSLARRGFALVAVWLAVTSCAVAALRFIAPPTTVVMWLEPGPLEAIAWRWVDASEISGNVARAVIAAEDQRFLAHRGFDLEQIDRALESYRDGGELRGASTITQQVAKNLFLWNGRSFVRKGLEAYFALLIEAFWPKERILEVYLNVAEFGPGVFGVDAAARNLLGTVPGELNAAEAARLAAVLPSPKRLSAGEASDYVRERAAEIEAQMRLLDERGHYRGLRW